MQDNPDGQLFPVHHLLPGSLGIIGSAPACTNNADLIKVDFKLRQVQACYARTTDSRHRFGVYENLLAELALTGPHQALVSDITYIRTNEGFLYLSLVMDAFSRAIVGFDCSDTLEREGALRALRQALGQLPGGSEAIHHSDRGSQYCCGDYVACLQGAGVRISMTQANHCYENAQAERLNGILKQEYGLGMCQKDKASAGRGVSEAVALYNGRRPHTSLGYSTPMRVHRAA